VFVSVDASRGRNTGLAIANIGTSSNPVTFNLYNQNGAVVGSSTVTLQPQNQIAQFINQLPGLQSIGTIEGSLGVSAQSRVSLVTLVLDGAQLSTLTPLPGRLTQRTSSVVVPGISNLQLAGMPVGCSISAAGYPGITSVPLNSPVEAGLGLVPGKSITITTGGTVKSGNTSVGPSGTSANTSLGTFINSPTCDGIPQAYSNVIGPSLGLVGIFLGPAAPALPRAPTLDFSGGAKDVVRVQPLLQQAFYIGTGSTTAGVAKEFVIPDGATRFYLAPLNLFSTNSDNTGSFTANLSINP
jgi:hypothetical protein